jgi:hypothetical protein
MQGQNQLQLRNCRTNNSALLTLSLLECQNLKLRQQRARASASNLVGRLAYVQSARSVQQHFWADGNSETELN